MNRKTKLVLSIRSLDVGGAERQFIELVRYIDKSKFEITVCTMYGGAQENIIKQIADITYVNLYKAGRYDFYTFYRNYKKKLAEIEPDIIYSFLGEMNLFSLWCKPKKTKIIWGFRASNMDLKYYGIVSRILFSLQKYFSYKVDKIISNSNASIEFHKKNGFNMSKAVVVHNGIDIDRFQRNKQKREEFRKKYNMNDTDIAIGVVSRIDYMKGYYILAKAAYKILDKYQNIYFFSVGSGDKNIKKDCEDILNKYNNKRFLWLGNQNRVEDLYSAFDISVSPSLFGEGFSNSIGEAMSSGLPSVVTNVGDSKIIVDNNGIVVNPNDVNSLYDGLKNMIGSDYKSVGLKAREHIVNNFTIEKMVNSTEKEILKCAE